MDVPFLKAPKKGSDNYEEGQETNYPPRYPLPNGPDLRVHDIRLASQPCSKQRSVMSLNCVAPDRSFGDTGIRSH